MFDEFLTDNLSIRPINLGDSEFVLELVNSPGWLEFIGDRNVKSKEEAYRYIENLLSRKVAYFVVYWEIKKVSIGIITYLKKPYLDYSDIGFAFLPQYSGLGFAYESCLAFLEKIIKTQSPRKILATTLPSNLRSKALIQKLGFQFEKMILLDGKSLELYGLDNLSGR
jgi:RimJ/RimL family protein N-acetyltransferase